MNFDFPSNLEFRDKKPSKLKEDDKDGLQFIFEEHMKNNDGEDEEEELNDYLIKIKQIGKLLFGDKFDKDNGEHIDKIQEYMESDIKDDVVCVQDIKEYLHMKNEDEKFDKNMFLCSLSKRKQLFQIKILWNKMRQKNINRIGQEEYLNLPRKDKYEIILREIINSCNFSSIILTKYKSMMYDLTKNKFNWIENMKNPIEHGGRAMMVSSIRKSVPLDKLVNFLPGGRKLENVDIQDIANHFIDYFRITRDINNNPIGVEVVDINRESKSIDDILSKLNLNDVDDIDNLITNLEKMDVDEKNMTLKKDQIRALIRTLSLAPGIGEKYNIVKMLRVLKAQNRIRGPVQGINYYYVSDKQVEGPKPEHNNWNKDLKRGNWKRHNVQQDTADITPIGEMDPDFDHNLIGVSVEMWKPYTTPTGKLRPIIDSKTNCRLDTEEVLRITKIGTYIFLLPELLVINGKKYYHLRRFYNFEDYLKSYQLNNLRYLEDEIISIKNLLKEKNIDPKLLEMLNEKSIKKAYEYIKKKQNDVNKNEKFLIMKTSKLILFINRISKINEYFIELVNKMSIKKKGRDRLCISGGVCNNIICDEATRTKIEKFINDISIKPYL
jgi:hypothetical protein